jgi:RNAse (barnase) inhibitor barstar
MSPFHFGDAAGEGNKVRVPVRLESKAELFEFLSRAVSLPGYFGHNWDALDECMEEVNRLGLEQITLVHEDIPLEKSPADQKTYLRILADIAENPGCLRIVFPERDRARIEMLLAETG